MAGNTAVGKSLTLTLTGSNTIATGNGASTDATAGLVLDGANARLTSNSLDSTTFTGNAGQLVKLTNGSNAGKTLGGTAASYNGVAGGSGLTPSQGLVIEDRLTQSLDAADVGFVQIRSATRYVTPASGSITRGFTAPAFTPGMFVYVGTGTYAGDVDTSTSPLILVPASTTNQYGQVTVAGSLKLGSSNTVRMDVAGSTGSDQITVSGAGNKLTAGTATLTLDYTGYATPAFADAIKLFAGTAGAAAIRGAFASPFAVTAPAAPPSAPTYTVTNGTTKYY